MGSTNDIYLIVYKHEQTVISYKLTAEINMKLKYFMVVFDTKWLYYVYSKYVSEM